MSDSQKSDEFRTKLDKIAETIADDVISGVIDEKDRVATFRALTAYYAMTRKLDPDESPEGGFNGFADEIGKVGRGSGAGRSAAAGGNGTDPDF